MFFPYTLKQKKHTTTHTLTLGLSIGGHTSYNSHDNAFLSPGPRRGLPSDLTQPQCVLTRLYDDMRSRHKVLHGTPRLDS